MKKLLFAFLCMIFLIGTTSAAGWDNSLRYEDNDMTAIITNWFGLGNEVGRATLKSHNNPNEVRKVVRGTNRTVMFYSFNFSNPHQNGLGDVRFTNMKKGEEIQKDYYFAEAVWGTRTVGIGWKTTCVFDFQIGNDTCTGEPERYETEEVIVGWIELNTNDIPQGKKTIGLVTDVKIGDMIDAQWKIAGKYVERHAAWTESLNIDIRSYYTMNETANPLQDLVSSINGTGVNTPTFAQAGIINGSIELDSAGANDFVNFTNVGNDWGVVNNGNYTINAWFRRSSSSVGDYAIFSDSRRFFLRSANTSFMQWVIDGNLGVRNYRLAVGIDTFTMITIVSNSTFTGSYSNGVLETFTARNLPNANPTLFNRINGIDTVRWDEFGVWNRTLTPSEITHLYNGGSGITFFPSFSPSVTLNSPADASITSEANVFFNCTGTAISPSTILNMSLWTNHTGVWAQQNITTGLSQQIEEVTFNNSFTSDDTLLWNCLAYDNNNNFNWALNNFTLTIDTTLPEVNVTSPFGNQGTFVSGINLTLNWSVTDINLDTCWYDYNGFNTTIGCTANPNNLTVTDPNNLTLTFYANDTIGNIGSDNTSWSYSFVEREVSFSQNASETDSEFFQINLTTDVNVLSIDARLIYNNTEFPSTASCSGQNCTLENTIDIPLIPSGESVINDFFWNFTIFNGSSETIITTSTRTQNVSRIRLEECGGSLTVQALNFTAFDEGDSSGISPFYFAGDFDFWLGSGTVKKDNSLSNISITEMNLCISPVDRNFSVDASIEYNDVINSTIYNTRNYFFQNSTINNITQHIPLFLLLASESTSFILKVQDNNLLPIRNVLIVSQRFNVGTGNFSIVQIAKTDDRGQSIGFFQTETVDYRFLITDQGRLLLQTLPQKIVGETAPFTLTFTIGEGVGKPWELFEDLPNLEVSLIYNRSSGNVVFTYIDTSGEFTLARLLVENQSLSSFGSEIICDINSFQSSGILTCSVGNVTESYIASGFITRGNNVFLVRLINFAVELFTAVVGLLGVFLGWFIILISAFAFKFNELAGIWIVNAAVIFVNMIQLISFGFVFIFAMIAVSIMITIMFNKPQ